jgi:hypothetical protein
VFLKNIVTLLDLTTKETDITASVKVTNVVEDIKDINITGNIICKECKETAFHKEMR